MIQIYSVIVTYNAMRSGWIEKCLTSLQNSTVQVKAIVIDNGSTDSTCDYVPNAFPDVIWIPQNKNLGFGQANNIGIKYALKKNADYVLLLNQDATLNPTAVQEMINISDGNSLISPIHLNGQGNAIDHMFKGSLRNAENTLLDDLVIYGEQKDKYETGEICAACWLMPISLIRKIGGFNPIYFHYGEDNNYYQRLLYHQIKTYVATKAFMYHDRLIHGNAEAFNKNKLHRDLLNIACNINNSFFNIIYGMTLRLFRCYFTDLPKKQYKIGAFCKETCWLLNNIKTILKSRKKEKIEQLNWL